MFTDKLIKSLKHQPLPYRLFEKGADKGFGVQVSTSAKTFFIQYKSPVTEKRRFMPLGTHPDTTLSAARQRCRNARDQVNIGIDPVIAREEQAQQQLAAELEAKKQAEAENATGTVTQLFDAYISRLKADGKPSYKSVQQIFDKDIKPLVGSLKARGITPEQIKHIIRAIYQRGSKVMANHARTYLMAAYTFGIKSDFDPATNTPALFRIESNPVRDIPVPAKVTPGERNLSADEIKELWKRLKGSPMAHSSKTAIRLLLATGGQRVEEVIGMRWDELDFDRKLWELSPTRTKNDRPNVVPLSDLAITLIRSMEPISSSTYVFPHRDNPDHPMPFRSLSQAVSRFCSPAIGKDGTPKHPPFPKFIPKDIRRTVKSRMGELGISKDIRDRLQNHALHDVSSKHYDRYDYLEPKKHAMDVWTQWLEGIISDEKQPENIIDLVMGQCN